MTHVPVCKLLPSGELTFCHGKIHHFFMGKSTISMAIMAIFNCELLVHQRVNDIQKTWVISYPMELPIEKCWVDPSEDPI